MTPRHALYVGWVLGIAWRHGVPVMPLVDADGNYTDRLVIDLAADNVTLTVVVPQPPDDWTFEPDARLSLRTDADADQVKATGS